MNRIQLGNTGIKVQRLGFGGIPIQSVSESEAVKIVCHAVEKGVDFIDTSRVYGTSERRIGLALQETDKPVVLASKSYARTADGILKDIEVSLKMLRRDKIELYQCHYVKDESEYEAVISTGGALDGLLSARDQGLIEHYGISSHSLDLYERVIEEGLFETIMVCYSLLEPDACEKIIPLALEKGIGVICMKPFSGGVIENAGLGLKFVLSQAQILVLAGVAHKDHFDENWDIYQHGSYRLSRQEQQEIAEIYRHHDGYFCRRCDYCQPCSEKITIQMVLNLKAVARRLGLDALRVPKRVKLLEDARRCSECGECVTRCPYQLPIPDLIKENIAWVEEQFIKSGS